MKSTDTLGSKGQIAWSVARRLIPRRIRWFYEGHPALRGQLWYAERKLLYQTIRNFRPQYCFEIGTWRGGGSTLFIAHALYENGGGLLNSVEVSPNLLEEAEANYRTFLPHLLPHVVFHLGDYREVLGIVLRAVGHADFVMLDGAEDACQSREQYDFFLPFLRSGSLLMVHDWFTEKARLIRPPLQDETKWKTLAMLSMPKSVGLALLQKR